MKRYWVGDLGMEEAECGAWVRLDDVRELKSALAEGVGMMEQVADCMFAADDGQALIQKGQGRRFTGEIQRMRAFIAKHGGK